MMWPEPELRAIIRPEPEMKNRSLHSTTLALNALINPLSGNAAQMRPTLLFYWGRVLPLNGLNNNGHLFTPPPMSCTLCTN